MDIPVLSTQPHRIDRKDLISFFFEEGKLNKDKLRVFVRNHLVEAVAITTQLITHTPHKEYWESATNAAVISGNTEAHNGIKEILAVGSFISQWLKESVESHESFEFFIRTKAAEISSSDTTQDYYYALKVRNDQLLAFVSVVYEAIDNIRLCLSLPVRDLFTHRAFRYFCEKTVEVRVFELATELYQERLNLGKFFV